MSSVSASPAARRGVVGLLGVVVAVAGSLLAFPLSGAAWFRFPQGEVGLNLGGQAVTHGLSASLPTAALAALFLMLVFGPPGKRLLGVVVTVLGLAMTAVALGTGAPDPGDVAVGAGPGGGGVRTTAVWAYAGAGLAVALGGLAVIVRPGRPAASAARAEDAWRVLDRGEDPTVG